MPKFRKKPVVIEAVEFVEGCGAEDCWGLLWARDSSISHTGARYETQAAFDGMFRNPNEPHTGEIEPAVVPLIMTLEGAHVVRVGDMIITGVKGERYPCKPDIFAETYEEVI